MVNGKKITSRFKPLAILLIFFFIALIYFAPLIPHFKDHVIGSKYTDVWTTLWGLHWVKASILGGANVFYTTDHCYPPGGKFYPVNLFNGLLSIPLQTSLNINIAYNVVIAFLLILGAYAAYLLIKYLTGDSTAGFIGGVIYGFSPCQIAFLHNGTDNLLNSAWIPLCILYALKTLREDKYTKNLFLTAFLLFLCTFSSWYIGLMTSMFMVLLFGYYFFVEGKTKRYKRNKVVKKSILIFLLFVVLISPFVYFSQHSLEGVNNLEGNRVPENIMVVLEKLEFSNFIDYFKLTPFWVRPSLQVSAESAKTTHFYHRDVFAYGIYLGYIVLLLAFIGGIFKDTRKETRIWIYSAIFFFALSLGPYLHWDGIEPVRIFGYKVALPYLALFKMFPFIFGIMNCPTRFITMVYLFLAVLSGFGVCKILKQIKKKYQYIIGIFIPILILLEFNFFSLVPAPLPLTSCADFTEYYHELAKEKGDFAILELPMNNYQFYIGRYFYTQSIHDKKSVYSLAMPPLGERVPCIAGENSFVEHLAYLDGSLFTRIFISEVDLQQGLDELKKHNFKYIVVHNDLFGEIPNRDVHDFLKRFLGGPSEYEDDISVYKIQ